MANNNYLIAVLSNRIEAEKAYSALEQEQVPMSQVSLLGRGFQSADEFGLINPDDEADKQSDLLAIWVIPFGFLAGFAFSVLSGLQTFAWAGEIGNHLIGGLLGAAAGALGAFVVGRITGWTVGSGDAIAYRNRLNAGKYLIIAQGTDELMRRATRVLRQFEPENIQGYTEPA
ncbi:MAG: hypothetical protein HC886_17355 [Leptolyngbyaceae cyanobacterium SM1_1_3]|nr:hypothetical protein [Leptolyngbyaceae cyanobacterium SM1_1_3]NJN02514.1 hypothetical protein [Leptolyngbyaceae cyanobacterium RM1_1_2]NJO11073.1 hypothetical protein [Leptolyngbyaceae cyanobacterium SL_1_1]